MHVEQRFDLKNKGSRGASVATAAVKELADCARPLMRERESCGRKLALF